MRSKTVTSTVQAAYFAKIVNMQCSARAIRKMGVLGRE